MPDCSNPVQCQTAKRVLCTCDCNGTNHGKLRAGLDSPDSQVKAQAEDQLKDLKKHQLELKKQKRIERRKKRVEARKA